MRRIYENETVMALMSAVSGFSFVVLLGTYVYSGSLAPSEQPLESGYAIVTWLMWLVLMLVPVATAILWTLRVDRRRK